ncbi:TonB-dependent receptor [Aquabacterium sp. OR-4]|uniref:TonB-dependent receptor n=1 Tax=Aquabacterium sp. OR-4 TaxID=2978127 RepID=UPI0021B26864|nr:TonB-dependent receptor [Aquabacterium sp. OR-4]MDT7837000.1 TonB-dependent receptor [Aquabacterium sp. OR-4]
MKNTPHAARPTPVAHATVLMLAGLLPALALAQGTAPATEGEGGKSQEVVITAQKRTERLKDTPVAAAVMSADALDKANATDISDISKLVPSVQLKGSFNGRVPYAMRGISTSANQAAVGLTSGVAILIDGVPVPSDSTAANELQDVRRVEVLKGPQATLGGRTASAGVMNFVTQAPARSFQGSLGLTLTNDNERRGNLFVTGPISPLLAYSLSLYGQQREYPIYNRMRDEHSRSSGHGARAKLLLSPDKTLDLTLTARVAEGESRGGTFTYQHLTAGAELFPYFPFNAGHGVTQATALPGITPQYGNTDYASPVQMRSKTRDRDLSLTIDKRVGDHSFSSTTAHQRNRQDNVQDVPIVATYFLNDLRGPIPAPEAGGPPYYYNRQPIQVKPTSLTQEFKVASPLNQPLSYVAGLFYSDVKVDLSDNREMFVNPKIDAVHSSTRSLGLYGRATWTISPSDSLLTGLRYNRDQIRYSIQDFGNALSSAGSDSAKATVGDLTWRHKFGNDRMAYATYARGYKPRAFNTAQTLQAADNGKSLAPVDKEQIDHYELGAKTTLLGGALTLNTAVFNTAYRNYQVQIFANDGTGYVNNLILSSAGKARTRGVEMDAVLNAGADTRVSASAAYIDARFLRYQGAACYPGQDSSAGCITASGAAVGAQDLSGKTMPDSPKLKLTLGLDHGLAQTLLPWDLRVNAQYAWRSAAVLQANQNPYTRQGAFGILNLGATASSPDGKYALTLFVNNVTNRFYLVNAEDFFSGLWGATANAVIGQPARDAQRYGGVRFSMNFD